MSARVKKAGAIISYNFVAFFIIANLLYWSIPTIASISALVSNPGRLAGSVYKSFIGWRQAATEGPSINVQGAHLQRRTINNKVFDRRKAYFFGGSTMWGLGSDDAGTIPSQFSAATGIHSENFGELGYTAHQSLVLLLQLLQSGHRPDLVVFYDGVNDVAVKCRREHGPESHGKEHEFGALFVGSDRPDSFTHHFRAVVRLAHRTRNEFSKSVGINPYDCDSNSVKSAAIAENLIRDWEFAKLLTESFGGTFVGVLQPVSYFSNTLRGHFKVVPYLEQQYAAIYPTMREKIAQGRMFHDLVSVLDVNERLYVDFNHITSNGNAYIAKKISGLVEMIDRRAPTVEARR
jgi:hypothetical protein